MLTLQKFISQYDVPGAVVLLEGKRKVLDEDKEGLYALGKLLASKTTHMIFRSGNAPGSDALFSEGVVSVAPKRLQVITPYRNHREKTNLAYDSISLDDIDLVEEDEIIYQSKSNKKTSHLIDKYADGERNRFTSKAAYIIRDTVKALGTANIPPATFGIFYDDLKNPISGGTGHTITICIRNKIPVADQTIWFGWLEE